jgi:hypothetical protein
MPSPSKFHSRANPSWLVKHTLGNLTISLGLTYGIAFTIHLKKSLGPRDASRNAFTGPQGVGLEVEPESQLYLTRSSHAERPAERVEDLAEG